MDHWDQMPPREKVIKSTESEVCIFNIFFTLLNRTKLILIPVANKTFALYMLDSAYFDCVINKNNQTLS